MKIDSIGKIKNIPDNEIFKKQEASMPKSTYSKLSSDDKGHIYDKTEIDNLKIASEKAYSHLKQIVEDLLTRQGKTINILNPKSVVNIDEVTRNQAKNLIDKDGPLGIEAVSDDIVNFAKAISGGNKDKLAELKVAIDKGYKAAEKILGKLPEISQKTYDKIMEKLDIWEKD